MKDKIWYLQQKNLLLIFFTFFTLLIPQGEIFALDLDDFNQPSGINLLGGASDIWTKNGAQIKSRYIFKSVEPKDVKGENGCSLRLDYDVAEKKQEAGYWSSLKSKNLGQYKELTFWIKGQTGNEVALVGIKDDSWFEEKLDIRNYLPRGKIATFWQRVVIPLDDFSNVYDWTSLNNFSITFNYKSGPPYKGVIYIDDFKLEGKRQIPPPPEKLVYESPDGKSLTDKELLGVVQKAAFYYFWNEADPDTGLIKDRCRTFYKDDFPVASIASVGFGLTAICVAEKHGWITYDEAYQRVLTTLKYLKDEAETVHGFYYHMIDMKDKTRWGKTEVSSIDTALLTAGVLFTGEYFKGTEVEKLADQIYRRIDWQWMLDGAKTLSMGWRPESGFIPYRWSNYNEDTIIYILAIGSPTHPIPPESWRAWSRTPFNNYKGYMFFGASALFTHQYSHIWLDFRNKQDAFADYFENSIVATKANRQWCLDNSERSKTYSSDSWGLTASDGPDGYKPYGAPNGTNDGTVSPAASIGSIVFTPSYAIDVIRNLYDNYKGKLWGRYGFADSYNWDRNWVSDYYIGIDEGPIVLMIENYQTAMVWKYFMQNEYIKKAMDSCGFRSKKVLEKVHAPEK